MVDVDDEGFANGAKEGGEDREISPLPWHPDEDQLEPHDHRNKHERREADTCDPAA